MALYEFIDVLLGFLAVFTTAEVFASFIVYWQPLFEEVKESCRAGIVHPNRRRLLWLVALTPFLWILAAVLYSRNLVALWYLMASFASGNISSRIAYTLMDLCLLLLIICGFGGLLLSGRLFYDAWDEVKNIYMIMKFRGNNGDAITDFEIQRGPPQNYDAVEDQTASTEESSDVVCPQAPGSIETIYDRVAGQVIHHGVSRPRCYDHFFYPQYPTPSQILNVRNVDPIEGQSPTSRQASAPRPNKSSALTTFPNFDSDGDTIESTPSSCSSNGNEDEKEQPGFDFDSLYDVLPQPASFPSKDDDVLESDQLTLTIAEQPRRSRCHSCSSEHTYSLPFTRKVSVRQPLSATSPSGPLGAAADTALSNIHCRTTWWERKEAEPSRPNGRVLPGKARSYNKVEPVEYASSEHASIQQVLGQNTTHTKTDAIAVDTIHEGRPDQVRKTPFEVCTTVDDKGLLLEVNEALHDLEQRDALEQEQEQHVTAAQAQQQMAEEANQLLRESQITRQRRLNNPYLNGKHYTVHGSQLPPATSPPRPGLVRATPSEARSMKLDDPYARQRSSCAPRSRLVIPPSTLRPAAHGRVAPSEVPPLTRVENWRRDVPRRKIPKLTLVIPKSEHSMIERLE